jgi:hypothetical protein
MRGVTGKGGLINSWGTKIGRVEAGVPDVAHARRVQRVQMLADANARRMPRRCDEQLVLRNEAGTRDLVVENEAGEAGVCCQLSNALFTMGPALG